MNLFVLMASLAVCLSAIYLALVIEVETVLSFLLLQDTTALFKN